MSQDPTPTYTNPTYAWESELYIAPGGSGRNSLAGAVRAENIKELKVTPATFSELENTLKKHQGDKAYVKGQRDVQVTFTLSCEYSPGTGDSREYAPDVQMILDAIAERNHPLCLFSITPYGHGFVGDFLVFGGEVTQDGDEIMNIPCTCKPYAGAPPVERYPQA